jgi:hypothetical protein
MQEFQKMHDESKADMKAYFVIIFAFTVLSINCCYSNSSISKCEWMRNCKQLLEEKWVLPASYFSAETPNILEKLNFIPNFIKH